jgi:hypothetical protein
MWLVPRSDRTPPCWLFLQEINSQPADRAVRPNTPPRDQPARRYLTKAAKFRTVVAGAAQPAARARWRRRLAPRFALRRFARIVLLDLAGVFICAPILGAAA